MRNLSCAIDTIPEADGMLVVWDCGEDVHCLEHADHTGARFERCAPDVDSLRGRLAVHHPLWLVIGPGIGEVSVVELVSTAWQTYPDLKLAMLGPVGDLRRCERWLRRGCHVYLPDSIPFAAMLKAIDCATAADAVLVDRAFYLESARVRHVGATPSLTSRQHQVLSLLDRQLTNPEIADALRVSENTIEFHVRRLLDKLGARNRVQAVRRAYDLGLI